MKIQQRKCVPVLRSSKQLSKRIAGDPTGHIGPKKKQDRVLYKNKAVKLMTVQIIISVLNYGPGRRKACQASAQHKDRQPLQTDSLGVAGELPTVAGTAEQS